MKNYLLTIKILVMTSLIVLTNYSCLSDDSSESPCPTFENRNIAKTFENIQGTIQTENAVCPTSYLIQPDIADASIATGLLFPCNLLDELKIDGTKVTFSGDLYELDDLDDLCAHPFRITKIEITN